MKPLQKLPNLFEENHNPYINLENSLQIPLNPNKSNNILTVTVAKQQTWPKCHNKAYFNRHVILDVLTGNREHREISSMGQWGPSSKLLTHLGDGVGKLSYRFPLHITCKKKKKNRWWGGGGGRGPDSM